MRRSIIVEQRKKNTPRAVRPLLFRSLFCLSFRCHTRRVGFLSFAPARLSVWIRFSAIVVAVVVLSAINAITPLHPFPTTPQTLHHHTHTPSLYLMRRRT